MEYLEKFVVVFIDDILIFSKNAEGHIEHICLPVYPSLSFIKTNK
jgi:hypothetical protein